MSRPIVILSEPDNISDALAETFEYLLASGDNIYNDASSAIQELLLSEAAEIPGPKSPISQKPSFTVSKRISRAQSPPRIQVADAGALSRALAAEAHKLLQDKGEGAPEGQSWQSWLAGKFKGIISAKVTEATENRNLPTEASHEEVLDVYARTFPHGITRCPTSVEGLQCGLHALRISMQRQHPGITPPTIEQLQGHISNDAALQFVAEAGDNDLAATENYRGDQLAGVLAAYGESVGQNLRLGFVIRDNLWLYPIQSTENQVVVWIWNDSAQDEEMGSLGHYEGIEASEHRAAAGSPPMASPIFFISQPRAGSSSEKKDVPSKDNLDFFTDDELVHLFDTKDCINCACRDGDACKHGNCVHKDVDHHVCTPDSRVVKISDTLVMKGGPNLPRYEADNQKLAQAMGFHVPTVRRVFCAPRRYGPLESKAVWYIVMDRIVGRRLDSIWRTAQKSHMDTYGEIAQNIARDLQATTVDKIRERIGRELGLGPVPAEGDPEKWRGYCFGAGGAGPFQDLDGLYGYMAENKRNKRTKMRGQIMAGIKPLRMAIEPEDRNNDEFSELVLCHGALSSQNIIREHATGHFYLLSWSRAGMYPRRYEMLGMMNREEMYDLDRVFNERLCLPLVGLIRKV